RTTGAALAVDHDAVVVVARGADAGTVVRIDIAAIGTGTPRSARKRGHIGVATITTGTAGAADRHADAAVGDDILRIGVVEIARRTTRATTGGWHEQPAIAAAAAAAALDGLHDPSTQGAPVTGLSSGRAARSARIEQVVVLRRRQLSVDG